MKIIISHDVDHVTVWEHKRDLIIPKFVTRSFIEYILGCIAFSEIKNRFQDFLNNKWQNIEELMMFDQKHHIPATFFVGVAKDKGMCYSLKNAKFWISNILDEGFNAGIHGIAYDNYNHMKNEYALFRKMTNLSKFGVRMHYLQHNQDTLKLLDKIGYLFDTSTAEMKNPFKFVNMWEFPLHIMDGHVFHKKARWQNQNLNQAKETTKYIIEEAFNKHINYFSILFHDLYFNDSFGTLKDWYIWVISYLKDNGFEFIDYSRAIKEIEFH